LGAGAEFESLQKGDEKGRKKEGKKENARKG
jgi:hypothetical protein